MPKKTKMLLNVDFSMPHPDPHHFIYLGFMFYNDEK